MAPKVIHRFDGGPVPLDEAIQQASLVYKQLELQLNKAQDKKEKKEIGKPSNTCHYNEADASRA